MRSRKARSDVTARLPSLPSSTAYTRRAQSERAELTSARPAASSGGASACDLPGVDRLQRIHDALADAAGRHVDHAAQADVVVRVDDQLQVGERVLDFLALVEPDASDDLVRDAFPHQLIFDRARLRVRAIEHGRHRVHVVHPRLLDRSDDEIGLLELVAAPEVDDLLAAFPVGPQPLVLAVAVLLDDRRGGVEDDLRGAVVLLEPDGLRLAEIGLEVEDVAQVGAAPLVDRLIGVADDGDVAMRPGEVADQQVLRTIRVLVLVHHHVLELARIPLADLLRCVEQLDRLQQQIVEVECVRVAQHGQVPLVDLARSARRAGSTRCESASGPSMRFFAWLIRDSATRGGTSLSSMPSSFSTCLTTATWSDES